MTQRTSSFKGFTKAVIEIVTTAGLDIREGWKFGEWHVGRGNRGDWTVTLIPTGFCLPFDFKDREQACACIKELHLLRPSWVGASHADIKSSGKQIMKICEDIGAEYRKTSAYLRHIDKEAFRSDLNVRDAG